MKLGKSIKLCECGCKKNIIITKWNKYKFPIYLHGHQSRKGSPPFMNGRFQQVMYGSLIGDGSILINKTDNYKYNEGHSLHQKEYLLWKNKKLSFNFHEYKDGNCYINKGDFRFKYYHDLFYLNGRKTVTCKLLNKLRNLGLAVWICDDSSYLYKDNTMQISTQSFGLEGNKIIQMWFKEKWRIESSIYKHNNKHIGEINGRKIKSSNSNYYIRINAKNTKKLVKLIKDYIPSCMRYKLGEDRKRREKAKERVNKQRKEWRLKNLENFKQYQKKYIKENKDKIKEQRRKYYNLNRDIILERNRIYWHKNSYLLNERKRLRRLKNG